MHTHHPVSAQLLVSPGRPGRNRNAFVGADSEDDRGVLAETAEAAFMERSFAGFRCLDEDLGSFEPEVDLEVYPSIVTSVVHHEMDGLLQISVSVSVNHQYMAIFTVACK